MEKNELSHRSPVRRAPREDCRCDMGMPGTIRAMKPRNPTGFHLGERRLKPMKHGTRFEVN